MAKPKPKKKVKQIGYQKFDCFWIYVFISGRHTRQTQKMEISEQKIKQKMASKKLARKKVGKIEKKMQKVGSQK